MVFCVFQTGIKDVAMLKKGEKIKIGLIVEDVFTDFAKGVIQSVIRSVPQDEQVEVVVIAGKYVDYDAPDDSQKNYKIVYNSIYRLEAVCDFDGLIIALGSMAKIKRQIIDNRYFKKLKDVPKVFMVSDMKDAYTVNYDNEAGIRQAVDYLVNVNGVTRFAMLGGRDDNIDALRRKSIFIQCLADNDIGFAEDAYEPTDMSVNTKDEATKLLDRNPKVKAIFCVNDAVAVGLYEAMQKKKLVPGKDIYIFGFDNTRMAGDLYPTLASIGSDADGLGEKSLSILLAQIKGEPTESAVIPTRLYGGGSFPYTSFDYNKTELINVDRDFIYRMFDDCFYRYNQEIREAGSIDLRELFFEFISNILNGVRNRYMSDVDFERTKEMIDKFFFNRAMDYTDSNKLLSGLDRLQGTINIISRNANENLSINRLFLHIRNSAINALSRQVLEDNSRAIYGRTRLQNFLIDCSDLSKSSENLVSILIKNFDKMGLYSSAFFMFDVPVVYEEGSAYLFPEEIKLRCYTKEGKLHVVTKDYQRGPLKSIFRRSELTTRYGGYIAYPVMFRESIYGILVCELTRDVIDRGEYIADQVGRALYVNHTQKIEKEEKELRAYNHIAESLSAKYESIYYINSANGDYIILKCNEKHGNLEVRERGDKFFDPSNNDLLRFVYEEDKEKFSNILSRDYLISTLKEREHISLDYRKITETSTDNMRLTVLWSSDRIHFVLGIENINLEVQKEEEHVRALTSERELARKDELTGVKNKNAYHEFEINLQKRIEAKADVHPFALVVCDINNLKTVNDSKGHKAGDEYIKGACKLICDVFAHSPVFRIGGDEFVAVLSGEDYFNREALLKKIRNKVIRNMKKDDGIIVATGMSDYIPLKDKSVTNVFERADSAMYENKNYLKFFS